MTADQLREALSFLGWTQRQAAHELEVAPRLLRYWASGDERYPIPRVASLALEYLVKLHTH